MLVVGMVGNGGYGGVGNSVKGGNGGCNVGNGGMLGNGWSLLFFYFFRGGGRFLVFLRKNYIIYISS